MGACSPSGRRCSRLVGNFDLAFLLASQEGRMLLAINDALRRIQKKTYGKCDQCGQPINPERLEAIPHALLCIQCQSDEEKNQ